MLAWYLARAEKKGADILPFYSEGLRQKLTTGVLEGVRRSSLPSGISNASSVRSGGSVEHAFTKQRDVSSSGR